ncbi:MAG: hypothetical protein D9V47_02120, partial [Clostridia bacterium]
KAKQITIRDQAILTDLARCRVLSFEQLKNAYWPKAKERTCRERLERLEKAGYLARAVAPPGERPGNALEAYYLRAKGRRATGAPRLFLTPGNAEEVAHQVRANQVYFELTEEEKATWTVGELLEAKGRQAPDARFVSQDGEVVYVEADTGHYKRHQVLEKLAAWGGTRQVWVCLAGRREGFLRSCGVKEVRTYTLPRKEAV